MNVTELNKAMQLAENFTIKLFKDTNTKQTVINVLVDKNDKVTKLDKIEPTKDGYLFNVTYKYPNAFATVIRQLEPIGLRMSSEAIGFLREFSKRAGKSKSAIVESLILELKNKNI